MPYDYLNHQRQQPSYMSQVYGDFQQAGSTIWDMAKTSGSKLGGLLTAGSSLMSGPVGIGLGLLTQGLSAFSSMKQAEEEVSMLGNQISDVKDAQSALSESFEQNKGLAREQYQEDVGKLSYSATNNLFDILQSGESGAGKTGLATSGSVTQNVDRKNQIVRDQYKFGMTDLESNLGKSLMDLTDRYESQQSDLQSELKRLQYARGQARGRTGLGGFTRAFIGA